MEITNREKNFIEDVVKIALDSPVLKEKKYYTEEDIFCEVTKELERRMSR